MNRHDIRKTREQILPYRFRILLTGKMVISKTNGQMLIVSHSEVVNILAKDDLDVHRRKMYEAALKVFENDGKVQ